MGKLTSDIFNESCCDGGATSEGSSCQPCGCDINANWVCSYHRSRGISHTEQLLPSDMNSYIFTSGTSTMSMPSGSMINNEPIFDFDKLQDVSQVSVKGQEVRITDEKTGGQKGSKLARFDLIPPEAAWALAEVYGKGCEKYADRNWERGYKWGLSVAALERHLNQWKRGISRDEETGCHHLMQVAWHAFTLFIFELRGLGTDDRFSS